MDNHKVEVILDALLEPLAAIEHERWSHWQRYMHAEGTRQSDGSIVIPPHLVDRWERQMATPFADLTEAEQESDREQVRTYLETIRKAFIGT